MKISPRTQASTDSNVGRGMDLALVTLVFLGIGYVLDRILDTKPVFMIGMFVFAVVGQTIKMWIGYDAKMKVHEAERAANIKAKPVGR
ncbi:MAG: AtpZ/AtpI family protein [Ilumatobacteraceae bacterium]